MSATEARSKKVSSEQNAPPAKTRNTAKSTYENSEVRRNLNVQEEEIAKKAADNSEKSAQKIQEQTPPITEQVNPSIKQDGSYVKSNDGTINSENPEDSQVGIGNPLVLTAPFDTRISAPWGSYVDTMAIGNDMPTGPSFMGSTSIANPHALVRFERLSSNTQHLSLLDSMGSESIRSSVTFKESLKATAPPEKLEKSGYSKNSDGSFTSTDGTNWQSDETGIFRLVDDTDNPVWRSPIKHRDVGPRSERKDDKNVTLTPNTLPYWNYEYNVHLIDAQIAEAGCDGKKPDAKPDAKKCKELNDARAAATKSANDEFTNNKWDQAVKENPKIKVYAKDPDPDISYITKVEPTVYNLVDKFGGDDSINKSTPYYWSDFLYCTYFNSIPNNYLITLRRYPVPITDIARAPDQDLTGKPLLPIAQAVTWAGEETGNTLASLLKFTTSIAWKEENGEVQQIQGNEQGAGEGGLDNPFAQGMAKFLGVMNGGANFGSISGADEQAAKYDPYDGGPYANRVYGPVNVISKTYKRDRGLDFENKLSIIFNYSLKSIGGINPKVAMLDRLANTLALTYNNAAFWGGAIRYFPNKPQYPFLGGKKGMDAWYKGDAVGFVQSIGEDFVSAMGNMGNMLENLFTNPADAIKTLLGGGAKLWMAKKQHNKRPDILKVKALLTGEPVGEWHLTIGNPFNPISMIGNLICTGITVEFNEQLSIDDFPTEMKVTVDLDHGRPRDKGDIESMFNAGGGRIHYSPGATEPWNNSSATRNSRIDTSWGKGRSSTDDGGTSNPGPTKRRGGFAFFDGDPTDLNSAAKTGAKVFNKGVEQAAKFSSLMGFKNNRERPGYAPETPK